jgi:hypothetical protein
MKAISVKVINYT